VGKSFIVDVAVQSQLSDYAVSLHTARYGYGQTRGSGRIGSGFEATGMGRVRVELVKRGAERKYLKAYPQSPTSHVMPFVLSLNRPRDSQLHLERELPNFLEQYYSSKFSPPRVKNKRLYKLEVI
jgi:hypothetical protein